jgi:hypothetical protein
MLAHLLSNSEVADVVKLCSPSLFTVLSVREVMGELRALAASRSQAKHQALVREHADVHVAFGVQMGAQAVLGRSLREYKTGVPNEREGTFDAKTVGEAALALYFRELFRFEETLIDFRPAAMYTNANDSTLAWAPAPMSVTWNHEFIANLRGVYSPKTGLRQKLTY